MPLVPVAEIEEPLAEGKDHARQAMVPVPAAFFDDLELAPAGNGRR
jgi:hypothetical protein